VDVSVADRALARSQRALQAAILDGAHQTAVPCGDFTELRPLTTAEGISVYGSAYRARHVDRVRCAFPVLGELLGSELEDLALDHLASRPGHAGSLEGFTLTFAQRACDAFRLHQWAAIVRDVVALDTALMDLHPHAGTDGRAPLATSSIEFARHGNAARTRFVANASLRMLRLVESSYVRSLAMRAGVPLYWSGDPGEDVAILRRASGWHAVFLNAEQARLMTRLVDGAELGFAALAESIDIACAVEWSSNWAASGIFVGAQVARPSPGADAGAAPA